MTLVHGGKEPPKLPVVDLCEDAVTLPVAGVAGGVAAQTSPVKPAWQRWNDYGIGCLLEGGAKRGNLRQAEAAFQKLVTLGEKDGVPHGHLNLARVLIEEGRLDDAAKALKAAGECDPPAPAWSRAWFTALVNSEAATRKEHLDDVIASLEQLLDPDTQERPRGFDFTRDYVVWNTLANRLFKRRQYEAAGSEEYRRYVLRAVAAANRVLAEDAEDVTAHDLLALAYGDLAAALPPAAPGGDVARLVGEIAGRGADKPRRVQACADLAAAVPALPMPKLATLREALGRLRPAFDAEPDAEVKAAQAAALAVVHRELHGVFKPDEIARSNAARIHRERNPAANYAARERVIYPTTPAHRDAILRTGELPPAR